MTVSRFVTSDKEMSRSRLIEEGYVGGGQNREVGGVILEDMTVSRFGTSDKEMLRSRRIEEGYVGGGRNREVGGVILEDMTVSRFGTSDKEMSRSRLIEEGYVGGGRNREVGGVSLEDMTVSRFVTSDKEMSQSRRMEEGYLRYIRTVERADDHKRDTSGGAAGRYCGERSDVKAQYQAVGTKSSEKLPSLLDVKLKHPEFRVERSYSAQHLVDRGGDTNQRQRISTVQKELDGQSEHDRLTDRRFNHGNHARDSVRRDEMSTFSPVAEETGNIYRRRSDLNWEKQRSPARLERTDVRGVGNRNVIGRSEHSRKDRRHVASGRRSTRP
jgi:hypothetical protein